MTYHALRTLLLALSVPALGIALTAILQLIPDKKLDDMPHPTAPASALLKRKSAK
jgi:hypothetical protein